MHYDTDFIGSIRVSPPLGDDEIDVLLDLADSQRTLRGTPTGRGNAEVPFARMAWDVCLDGCCLWWTGEEDDKWIGPSLAFMVDHWFRHGAVGEGHPRLAAFTFDHVLDGVVAVRGRDRSTLVEVSSNVVTWRLVDEPCDGFVLRVPPGSEPSGGREPKGRPLPSNVIDLRSRRAGGGGGAAG
ncbi:hypothetical protein ACS3YM_14050 [Nocardia sp. N13]|jgi:hypothetical protein|uniref:hypothetical protein n=1 Tax=Nocardioides sp. N13(2025) TaxID=3453405 RepID=UPI003F76ED21